MKKIKKVTRKSILLGGTVLILAAVLGCGLRPMVTGSGNLVVGTVDIGGVDAVSVGDTCNLTVTNGPVYSMTVETDDNILEYVKVEMYGDSLDVELSPHFRYTNITFNVAITLPDLEEVSLSGASTGTLDPFTLGHDLTVDLSGASTLASGTIACRDLDISLSGASSLSGVFAASNTFVDASGASEAFIGGSTASLYADGSGASSLYLEDYETVAAWVDLSGASYGEIHCTGQLDVDLSGASTLYFSGNPFLGSVDISGASLLIPVPAK